MAVAFLGRPRQEEPSRPPKLFERRVVPHVARQLGVLGAPLGGGLAEQRDVQEVRLGGVDKGYLRARLEVLSNMESLNSMLILQGLTAPEWLQQLNRIAIVQMRSLLTTPAVRHLTGRNE